MREPSPQDQKYAYNQLKKQQKQNKHENLNRRFPNYENKIKKPKSECKCSEKMKAFISCNLRASKNVQQKIIQMSDQMKKLTRKLLKQTKKQFVSLDKKHFLGEKIVRRKQKNYITAINSAMKQLQHISQKFNKVKQTQQQQQVQNYSSINSIQEEDDDIGILPIRMEEYSKTSGQKKKIQRNKSLHRGLHRGQLLPIEESSRQQFISSYKEELQFSPVSSSDSKSSQSSNSDSSYHRSRDKMKTKRHTSSIQFQLNQEKEQNQSYKNIQCLNKMKLNTYEVLIIERQTSQNQEQI